MRGSFSAKPREHLLHELVGELRVVLVLQRRTRPRVEVDGSEERSPQLRRLRRVRERGLECRDRLGWKPVVDAATLDPALAARRVQREKDDVVQESGQLEVDDPPLPALELDVEPEGVVPGVRVERTEIGLGAEPRRLCEIGLRDLTSEHLVAAAEPGVGSQALLLEREVELHRPLIESDHHVRRGPRCLVEDTQRTSELADDGQALGPELFPCTRPRDNDQVDVGQLVAPALGQRALEDERPHTRVAGGPAGGRVDEPALRVRHRGDRIASPRMAERLVVTATDYHTAGEPFRIVTGGVPEIPGATILAKRRWATEHLDHVRALLVNEPRGHADMYGCFVVEPEDSGSDLGVLFFHNAGFSTACGHGTIALARWAVDTGRVTGPDLAVDAPSGRLPVTVRESAVSFRNVAAWVEAEGLEAGELRVDIAYGGAFYGSVRAEQPIEPANVDHFISLGRAAKRELEAQREFAVPSAPDISGIYGVVFWQDEGEANGALVQRNVAVFADGEVDRSPCGSGTSARLALLHAGGQLALGGELVHRSIVGTEFRARVVEEIEAQGRPAVVTEIEGDAHPIGTHEFVLEPDDPLGTGFQLR